ncbi:MAG: DUF3482 domain-containing protein [Planctomycetota bacterium]|nr:MAG: DUF3482 domain-containing protein [Planctomycetota bacterium]
MSDPARPPVPTFVVVGHVNKGKSSVVATLTEDDTVPIDRTPGTTRRSGEYELRIGGEPVLRLVDTPGFQDAPAALEWLRARAGNAAERPRAVAEFVAAFRGGEDFADEVELLGPLTGKAAILYVVDASRPYRPVYEAEMEILRWTGRPGMALLNRIGADDHAEEWKPVLRQFFHLVREFDAHHAGFAERLALIRAFAEVHDEWRAPVERAAARMEAEEAARRRRALRAIAAGVLDCLGHVERKPIQPGQDPAELDEALRRAFHDTLRRREQRTREEVARLYRHHHLGAEAPEFELLAADLFSDTSFELFGLTRPQLALRGAAWGAAAGAVIDLMVGGLSFFAGAVLGGLLGGGAAWIGSTRIARSWGERSELFRRLFPGETGRFRCFGPVTNPAFAWVLLDRALLHFRAVSRRAHACREPLRPETEPGKQGLVHRLPAGLHQEIDRCLRAALDGAKRGRAPGEEERARLADLLDRALAAIDGSEAS